MNEFVDVKGYEGYYKVNRLGQVKSLEKKINCGPNKKSWRIYGGKNLKPFLDNFGYLRVNLMKDNKRKVKKIHRLLAEHFIPNPENLPLVDHKNRNKTDNRLENLRWTSYSLNSINVSNKGNTAHKFICQFTSKRNNNNYYIFCVRHRGEKNIHKRFNKKKFTLQQVIEFRDKYCKENDIEIIE